MRLQNVCNRLIARAIATASAPVRKDYKSVRFGWDIQKSRELHFAQIDGDFVRLFSALKKIDHFLVLHLCKVPVERTDRVKRVRHIEANHLIHLSFEPCACRRWSNRDRQHEHDGLHLPECLDGGIYARSCGNAIIHKNDRPAGDLQGRPVSAIQNRPPIQFLPYLRGDTLDLLWGDTCSSNDSVIEIPSVAGRNRTERQLSVAGHA